MGGRQVAKLLISWNDIIPRLNNNWVPVSLSLSSSVAKLALKWELLGLEQYHVYLYVSRLKIVISCGNVQLIQLRICLFIPLLLPLPRPTVSATGGAMWTALHRSSCIRTTRSCTGTQREISFEGPQVEK